MTALGEGTALPPAFTFFGRIGLSLSYGVPLVIVAIVLAGDSIVERSEGYALASSLVLCFAVTFAYLLKVGSFYDSFTGSDAVRLLQINALILAGFALAWLMFRQGVFRMGGIPGGMPKLLQMQVSLGLLLNGAILLPAAICLGLTPTWASSILGPAGGIGGWASLIAAVGAALASGAVQRDRLTFRTLALASLAGAIMMGLSVIRMFPGQGWIAFHTLLSANAASAWGLLGLGWWMVRRGSRGTILSTDSPLSSPGPGGTRILNYQRADATRRPFRFILEASSSRGPPYAGPALPGAGHWRLRRELYGLIPMRRGGRWRLHA